jgi:hypothetical protein
MTMDSKGVSLRSMGQRRAKLVLEKSIEGHAIEWLDFEVIQYPNSPAQCSKLVNSRRWLRGESKTRRRSRRHCGPPNSMHDYRVADASLQGVFPLGPDWR